MWVKIENGVVAQKQPNIEPGFIECDDSVVVGMTHDGGVTFSNPVPTLAASQSARRNELRALCSKAILGLYSSSALGSAHSYDNRRDDQSNLRLRQAVSTIDSQPRGTYAHNAVEFTWTSHTTAQLNQVMIDMEAHITAQQVNLATKIAQVNAVNSGDLAADAITIAAIAW